MIKRDAFDTVEKINAIDQKITEKLKELRKTITNKTKK